MYIDTIIRINSVQLALTYTSSLQVHGLAFINVICRRTLYEEKHIQYITVVYF